MLKFGGQLLGQQKGMVVNWDCREGGLYLVSDYRLCMDPKFEIGV